MPKKTEQTSASPTPPQRPSQSQVKTSKSGRVTFGPGLKLPPIKSKSRLLAATAASMVPTRATRALKHPTNMTNLKSQSRGASSSTALKTNGFVNSRSKLIWGRKR